MFFYMMQQPSLILALSVKDKYLTIYYQNTLHAQTMLSYVMYTCFKVKEFKNAVNNPTVEGITSREDVRHMDAHPCKDALKDVSHLHYAFEKDVTYEQIQFYLARMNEFQSRPSLRKQQITEVFPVVLQKARIDRKEFFEHLDIESNFEFISATDKAQFEEALLQHYGMINDKEFDMRPYHRDTNHTDCVPQDFPLPEWQLPHINFPKTLPDNQADSHEPRQEIGIMTIAAGVAATALCCFSCYRVLMKPRPSTEAAKRKSN